MTSDNKIYVVAEIGHNHKGSIEEAKKLFREAKAAGANAVKLQKRDNKSLYTKKFYNQIYDNPNSSTTYIVEGIDVNGCDRRGEVTVDVLQPPVLSVYSVPNPPNICLGDSVVLESSSGFVNYFWINGMTGDRIVDFPTQDSWYMVEAVDSNGCVVKEDIWVYVDSCNTSVNALFNNQLKIYPNPTSRTVNIQIPEGKKFDLTLIDIAGKMVLEKKQISSKKLVLNTKKIRKGTYLIELKNVENRYINKLVVE